MTSELDIPFHARQRRSKSHVGSVTLMNFPRLAALVFALIPIHALAAAPQPPETSEPGVKISLFAAEPQVNTPIGAAVDAKGRLFVIESNTHFRPKDYKGPATDRILMMEDTTGAGKADRVTT